MAIQDYIAAALATALPPELRQAAPALSALIAALSADPAAAPEAVSPEIAAALRVLTGHKVEAAGKLLDFSNAQTGDISVGDVAGGDMIKLTIPITHSEHTTQSVSAGEGGTISQVVQLKIDGSHNTIVIGGGNANATASVPPLETPPLTDGSTIFLADGGTGSAALAELATLLTLRGVRVWREPTLGALDRRTYDEALASMDAAVVALTPDSCDADRLLRVELPAIWARYERQVPFWVVPLLGGSPVVLRQVEDPGLGVGPSLRERQLLAEEASRRRGVLPRRGYPHVGAIVRATRPDSLVVLSLFSNPSDDIRYRGEIGRTTYAESLAVLSLHIAVGEYPATRGYRPHNRRRLTGGTCRPMRRGYPHLGVNVRATRAGSLAVLALFNPPQSDRYRVNAGRTPRQFVLLRVPALPTSRSSSEGLNAIHITALLRTTVLFQLVWLSRVRPTMCCSRRRCAALNCCESSGFFTCSHSSRSTRVQRRG